MESAFIFNQKSNRLSSFSKNDEAGIERISGDDSTLRTNNSLPYKSNIASRTLVIQRSSVNSQNGSNTMIGSGINKNLIARHGLVSFGGLGQSLSSFAMISSTGVSAVKQSSDKEKRDMQDLNERFASYIEKVRFLEAQNRKLSDELEKLKSKWGKETCQIKAMYQTELDEARRVLDETTRDKVKLEIMAVTLGDLVDETKLKLTEANNSLSLNKLQIEKQNRHISDYEAELNLLRKRVEGLDMDREKDKKMIMSLEENLNRTKSDLDQETLLHIDAENKRQTLQEEIDFLKTIHEQELKELSALAYRDSTPENREYWKVEMGDALREIQLLYDDKLTSVRNELEGFYNLKVQELKNGVTRQFIETNHSKEEAKRLRIQMSELKDRFADHDSKNSQLHRDLDSMKRENDSREKELTNENDGLKRDLAKLKAQMDSILIELQNILEDKLGLELEIAAYRKLLEGEENRSGFRNIIEGTDFSLGESTYSLASSGYGGFASGGAVTSSPGDPHFSAGNYEHLTPAKIHLKGEMSAKTTYQKTAKGPISVSECSQDGKFIVVDNTNIKDENIGGWKIVRTVDNNKKVEYVFEDGFIMDGNSKFKVWAHGSRPEVGSEDDLECGEVNWGVGSNISTKIFNNFGEERATHIQKTIYI